MNIDMLVSAILYSVMVVYLGNFIFGKVNKIFSLSKMITLGIYAVFIYANGLTQDKMLKVICLLICIIFLYKLIYERDWIKTLNGAILAYVILFSSELLCGIFLTVLSGILDYNLMSILYNSIVLNVIIAIIIFLFTLILKNISKNFFDLIEKHQDLNLIVLFIIMLSMLTLVLNRLTITDWAINSHSFVIITLLLFSIFVIISLTVQKLKYSKFKTKYSELAEYSTVNDEVLEDYRVKTHEFRNQLAIIKSMSDPKNIELNEYVDNLIEKNKNVKYNWINQVKYIKLPGLKGLLNYKIIEFNSLKIGYKIVVSKNLAKEYFNNFTIKNKDDLYSIIGVYLDNAKEAALESEKKEVSIDISKSEDGVMIRIANTYNNEKVDYTKLDEYKYSTKGKNRGIGLYLVQKIVNKNKNLFRIEREITDKYFIQTLYVKTK